MTALVPLFVFVVGLVGLVKPGWLAAVEKRRRATGTTMRPRDVEMTDGYLAFVRVAGALVALVGLALLVATPS